MPEELQGPRATLGRGWAMGRARGRRPPLGRPPALTFFPIYSSAPEMPKERPFSRNSTRGAAATKNPKTGVLQTCPGTLPEGEIVVGCLFITMPAPGEMRE